MISQEEAAEKVYYALALGLAGDTEQAAELMTQALMGSDEKQAYALCRGIAAGGHKALLQLFGDKAPNVDAGDYWAIHQLKDIPLDDDPARAFSLRFLIAHCNRDVVTTVALWAALLDAGEMERLQGAGRLFGDVVSLLRSAEQHKRAGGG